MRRFIIFALTPLLVHCLDYQVRFIGLEDKDALKSVINASELVSLQKRPPASINGLKIRAQADIPNLMAILHAYAYYDANITTAIENDNENITVEVFISPGPQFLLKDYHVYSGDCTHFANPKGCHSLDPEVLGLVLKTPALSTKIIDAELNVLNTLSRCGFPLAYIDKRRVEVDMKTHLVSADSCVHEGPLSKFGPITIFGIENVKPNFITEKLSWNEGEIYNSDLIQETQNRLLSSELFSSVLITHSDKVDEQGYLPLKLRIAEAKHNKIAVGAFYATVNGPGGNLTWTNRNFRGMGEILSVKLEYAQYSYTGNIQYKKPDFLRFDQNYKAYGEINHEKIKAYNSKIYRLANYIERKLSKKGYLSIGLKADFIKVTESASNGNYSLIGAPFFGKYEYVDDKLDPKSGFTVAYSITPYQSLKNSETKFAKQRFTGTFYLPIIKSKNLALAFRVQAGSIAGTKRQNVPLPKLFLGGSEDELRGYKYQTVSPLHGHKPLGGRSAIYTSTELRIRLWDKIGVVPFFDAGSVTNDQFPTFTSKWLKSVGVGVRYFAFFGPFRVDIGFPLNPRKGIDSFWQLYASIGQAF